MARRGMMEKRRYKRINRLIAVNIIKFNNRCTAPKLDEEIGFNISLGGILIECSKRLPRGSSLRFKVMLPFDSRFRIIEIPGRVVWNKRSFRDTYYIGCKFTRLSQGCKSALKKFMRI